jgi:hypothetical protein
VAHARLAARRYYAARRLAEGTGPHGLRADEQIFGADKQVSGRGQSD